MNNPNDTERHDPIQVSNLGRKDSLSARKAGRKTQEETLVRRGR